MTVNYNEDILTVTTFYLFKILFRWRGSVLKLIFVELLCYLIFYAVVSCVYRFALKPDQQRFFEGVSARANRTISTTMPIGLLLGLHIHFVFGHFWKHFNYIPECCTLAHKLIAFLPMKGARDRLIRRTIIRYVIASLALTTQQITPHTKRVFGTMDALIKRGLLTMEESEILFTIHPKHAKKYVPVSWATSLLILAESEGRITNHDGMDHLIMEVKTFYRNCQMLSFINTNPIPLSLMQVVSYAVNVYFAISLIGRQYLLDSSPKKLTEDGDFIIPFFTIVEFIVFMGWLKIAESMSMPTNDSDEGFDTDECINYEWIVAMMIADGVDSEPPEFSRDKHWKMHDPSIYSCSNESPPPYQTHIIPFFGHNFNLGVKSLTQTPGTSYNMLRFTAPLSNILGPVGAGKRLPSLLVSPVYSGSSVGSLYFSALSSPAYSDIMCSPVNTECKLPMVGLNDKEENTEKIVDGKIRSFKSFCNDSVEETTPQVNSRHRRLHKLLFKLSTTNEAFGDPLGIGQEPENNVIVPRNSVIFRKNLRFSSMGPLSRQKNVYLPDV